MDSSHGQGLPAQEPIDQVQQASLNTTGTAIRSIWSRILRKFQAWSIERRILVGFCLVFAGILVISAVSYRNMTVLLRNSHQDTRSHELIQLLIGMGIRLDEAEDGHRRYLVTGDESYLKPHEILTERLPEYLRYVRELTHEDPAQGERVDLLGRSGSKAIGCGAGRRRRFAERPDSKECEASLSPGSLRVNSMHFIAYRRRWNRMKTDPSIAG